MRGRSTGAQRRPRQLAPPEEVADSRFVPCSILPRFVWPLKREPHGRRLATQAVLGQIGQAPSETGAGQFGQIDQLRARRSPAAGRNLFRFITPIHFHISWTGSLLYARQRRRRHPRCILKFELVDSISGRLVGALDESAERALALGAHKPAGVTKKPEASSMRLWGGRKRACHKRGNGGGGGAQLLGVAPPVGRPSPTGRPAICLSQLISLDRQRCSFLSAATEPPVANAVAATTTASLRAQSGRLAPFATR